MARHVSLDAEPGFGRTVSLPFEEALERTEAALQDQGFGVLTRIDVRATLKEKLDVEHPPYVILGACNPPLAHQALTREPDVGLLLPCNVVVRELPDGRTRVEAANPQVMARLFPEDGLEAVAREATERLHEALEAI